MFKNVIVYQLKDSNNRWDDVKAYIPSDQNDYIRCCQINANDKGQSISVLDIKDFDSADAIYEEISKWKFAEEIIVFHNEIYNAQTKETYVY